MNPVLLPVLVAVPLLGAALLVLPLARAAARALFLGTSAFALAAGVVLLWATREGQVHAHQVGLWPAGVAIPFAADTFSALMITTTALLVLVCSAFAVATGEADRRFFPSLVLVLSAGVYGALLTGDLFNLFVFVEVMLLPSYGLMAIAGTLRGLRGGRTYVAVNLLTSTVFLAGVALVYGAAGTVQLGELAGAAQESPVVAVAMGVVLLAMSVKAAVVPVHGWLARTYTAPSPAVTALFSGLHTKVAVYAIYRLYAVVFGGESSLLWVGLVLFGATMLVGVLGAVGENTTRSILVFHMVSQIGYILLGVALFTELGLMAGIFYLVHHMVVKASLFLSTGAIEHVHGTGVLDRLGGLARREPLLALAFLGAALSLAGLPPFSGFVAKLTLVAAAFADGQWVVAALAVAVSLITLMSMLKIWGSVFWGPDPDSGPEHGGGRPVGGAATATAAPAATRMRAGLVLPAVALTGVTLCVGLGAQVLLDLSAQAAAHLLDTSTYVEAVTNR
ncbi:monovalent cation/H+ antiporter subunit D family protein [Nocardiopsis dassonvillei]|uniref:monovalent cation/H+ antiporter subunit D family protein n=1 Tax=Nocardiopsis dassonvillei TaxID=2014 RepID=UPI00200E712C|nr:monovalent cation/H+ antiporter subunit D family protein [Nocardiopsis dassonvillei]MCK9868553.1 monovalent cation/H+ antiporter subunit D family protein [Nocardiopsis dassonvillei]